MGTTKHYKHTIRKTSKYIKEKNKSEDGIIDYELLNESVCTGTNRNNRTYVITMFFCLRTSISIVLVSYFVII